LTALYIFMHVKSIGMIVEIEFIFVSWTRIVVLLSTWIISKPFQLNSRRVFSSLRSGSRRKSFSFSFTQSRCLLIVEVEFSGFMKKYLLYEVRQTKFLFLFEKIRFCW
jgi:hypothetical protein